MTLYLYDFENIWDFRLQFMVKDNSQNRRTKSSCVENYTHVPILLDCHSNHYIPTQLRGCYKM